MKDHNKTKKQLLDELPVKGGGVAEMKEYTADQSCAKLSFSGMNAQLNAIIQAFDGLIYICSRDYRVEFMNERLIERTGYDATGEACYKVLHDLDSVCPWCVNDRVFKGETVRWEVKSPKDNRCYYVMNSPVFNEDGTISKQAMIIDITDRKLAEEALLRKSEEKYRDLVENANSIIFRRDYLGNVTFFNEFAQRFFGYSEEEIIGKNVVGTIVPDVESTGRDLRRMIEDIGLHTDRYTNNINENMRRNGERVWVAWTNRPVYNDNGEITEILCIGNDITDRKQAEDALRKVEREKSAIMDAMSELVILLDTDMKVVWSNNAVNRQFNLQARQLEGKYCYEALHGLKRPCRICPVGKVIETGESCTIDEFFSFDRVWTLRAYPVMDEDGNLTGIVEIVTDITERKKAEESLQHVLQYLQELNFIVNKSPVVAFLWRASDGWPVEFVSENIALFGYMPDDLISGRVPYTSIIHPDDLKRVAAEVAQYTQEGRTEFTQEYRILTKSGEVRLIDDRTWVRRDADGRVTHYQGIVFDITERKRAEEELRRVNSIQSLILGNSVMGIGFVRNRIFEWVNPRLPEMLGLPLNRVQGSDTRIIYPSDEIYEETGRNAYSALTRGEWFEFEIAMPRSDGTTFAGRIIGKALNPSLPQEGSIWIFENITEKKRIEDALRESQQQLADIINFLPDATFVIDKEGKVIAWNKAIEDMTGIKAQDMVGKGNYEYSLPLYGERRPILIDLVLKPQEEIEAKYVSTERGDMVLIGEAYMPAIRGGEIYFSGKASILRDSRGNIIGAIESIRDITVRRRAEEALIRAEGKYRGIFENAVMGIFQTTPSGRIISANQAFARILGYDSPEEAINTLTDITRQMYVDPEHRSEFLQIIDEQGTYRNFEAQVFRKDRNIAWITMNGRAVRDSGGEILYYEGTIQDITNHKLMESRLLQGQKMESIGTLAGGIAHDFNNILAAIIGYTEITKGSLQQPDLLRHLERVLEASHRARELVAQILTFSRRAEREMRLIEVNSLIKESLKLLRATIPSTIKIRLKIVSRKSAILGDPTQMHQILMNLCTNAVHAMRDKGGVLEVGLDNEEITSDKLFLYPDLKPGLFVKLTVADTGTGIAPDIADRIFDPFFTTKARDEGTGLGLSVVYGIVKEYGGTITVQSKPGVGSTFIVYMPAIEHGVEVKTEIDDSIPRGNERILFIDDEGVLAEMGQKMLKGLGYEVTVSTSSIDALAIFRSRPGQYDLVVTDMTMPGLTGKDLAKELLQIQPDIPIILCTGFSELITEKEAKQLGVREFLMKPITFRDFARVVRKVLDKKKE